MEQEIRFCTTADGVRIAYATIGDEGPPVIYVNGWPTHLQLEWELPHARRLIEDLARGCTLVRYDMRGTGLSDREVTDFSLPTLLQDLEAVIGQLELDRFVLLSLGMLATPLAITYAAANPDHVTHLVLSSAFIRGQALTTPERQKTMIEFVEQFGFPHFGVVDQPNVEAEDQQGVRSIQRAAATREVEAAILRAVYDVDVSAELDAVTMPTLVIHGRGDRGVPTSQARELAARIAQCKFVSFDGASSMAWAQREVIIPELRSFLGLSAPSQAPAADVSTILFTDIESSTAITQRLGDMGGQEFVRTHNTVVRQAIEHQGGTEIKHTGDGIMAAFPSASGALHCATEIQQGIEQRAAESGLRVRIGLNAGEPLAEERDLFGTAVQLARRLCDHAKPGQVLVSDVVRQLAAGKPFAFDDLGEVVPKGFEQPVRLFELRWRDA